MFLLELYFFWNFVYAMSLSVKLLNSIDDIPTDEAVLQAKVFVYNGKQSGLMWWSDLSSHSVMELNLFHTFPLYFIWDATSFIAMHV